MCTLVPCIVLGKTPDTFVCGAATHTQPFKALMVVFVCFGIIVGRCCTSTSRVRRSKAPPPPSRRNETDVYSGNNNDDDNNDAAAAADDDDSEWQMRACTV